MEKLLPAETTTASSELLPLVPLETCASDYDVQFTVLDLLMMLVSGFLGTLTAVALKNFFAEIHDHFGKKAPLKGGHSGEVIDIVPGNSMPGGFGHRWKHGHDILNPFEVDWDFYIDLAKQSGTKIPVHLKAYFYWLRHLFQDTFSTEGLPLPGNSILRLFCNFSDPQVRAFLQVFGTIKARDITGSGVTNLLLNTYLKCRKDRMNELSEAYMFFAANAIAFLTGLIVPVNIRSANLNSIPILIHFSRKIYKIQKVESEILARREEELAENDRILAENDDKLYQAICNSFEQIKNLEFVADSNEMLQILESYGKILTIQEVS